VGSKFGSPFSDFLLQALSKSLSSLPVSGGVGRINERQLFGDASRNLQTITRISPIMRVSAGMNVSLSAIWSLNFQWGN
jgi:hypothetical protein